MGCGPGLPGRRGRVEVSATYFDIGVDNLIDFDEATFRLQNVTLARTSGVEFGAIVRPWRRSKFARMRPI